MPRLKRENDVVAHRQVPDDAVHFAIFGAERETMRHRITRIFNADLLSAQYDLALIGGHHSKDQIGRLGSAGPQQTGQSDDFALANFKRERRDHPAFSEVCDFDQRLTSHAHVAGFDTRLKLAAQHHCHHFMLRDLCQYTFTDHATVAQDRSAVGNSKDLVKEMRNEYNG